MPVRSSAVRRFLAVRYLKERREGSPSETYPFQPRVVSREGSVRMTTEVAQAEMSAAMGSGKSEPRSMIQPTVLESGGGEKSRAPSAEYVPAPPRISTTGGLGDG